MFLFSHSVPFSTRPLSWKYQLCLTQWNILKVSKHLLITFYWVISGWYLLVVKIFRLTKTPTCKMAAQNFECSFCSASLVFSCLATTLKQKTKRVSPISITNQNLTFRRYMCSEVLHTSQSGLTVFTTKCRPIILNSKILPHLTANQNFWNFRILPHLLTLQFYDVWNFLTLKFHLTAAHQSSEIWKFLFKFVFPFFFSWP